jgi:metal-responsive CopG/Arc/MetJ family transcriptional regulator
MKTAVSIPDEIFASADRLAKRLQMSRSELYARAVELYVTECRHTGVKEKLDEVYMSESESVDQAVLNAQAASISMEEW